MSFDTTRCLKEHSKVHFTKNLRSRKKAGKDSFNEILLGSPCLKTPKRENNGNNREFNCSSCKKNFGHRAHLAKHQLSHVKQRDLKKMKIW